MIGLPTATRIALIQLIGWLASALELDVGISDLRSSGMTTHVNEVRARGRPRQCEDGELWGSPQNTRPEPAAGILSISPKGRIVSHR